MIHLDEDWILEYVLVPRDEVASLYIHIYILESVRDRDPPGVEGSIL
jgi:hypothetical protein